MIEAFDFYLQARNACCATCVDNIMACCNWAHDKQENHPWAYYAADWRDWGRGS